MPNEPKRETTLERGTRISQYAPRHTVYIRDLPEIPRNLPKVASKWMRDSLSPYRVIMTNAVASLNSHGGKIYFGVTREGIVEGCVVNRETTDHYQLICDDVFSKIQPIVPRQSFRVEFLPVVMKGRSTRFQVMCIRVDGGNKSETYWDNSNPNMPKMYLRSKGIVTGPLGPNEIGQLVLERYQQFLHGGGRINAIVRGAPAASAAAGSRVPPSAGKRSASAATDVQPLAKRLAAAKALKASSSSTSSNQLKPTTATAAAAGLRAPVVFDDKPASSARVTLRRSSTLRPTAGPVRQPPPSAAGARGRIITVVEEDEEG